MVTPSKSPTMAPAIEIPTKHTFVIDLDMEEPTDTALKISNRPVDEVHRKTLTERINSGFVLQGKIKEIFHGTLTPKGKPATLMILDFNFLKTALASSNRRFRRVIIEIRFFEGAASKDNEGAKDPAVLKMAPEGVHTFNHCMLEREINHKFTLALGSNPLQLPNSIAVTGAIQWEKVTKVAMSDKTSMTGMISHDRHRRWGSPNTVVWTCTENAIKKDGVPAYMQTAVLVERLPGCDTFKLQCSDAGHEKPASCD